MYTNKENYYNEGSKKDERNMVELRLISSNMKLDKEKSKVISNWTTGIANTINQDRKDRRKNIFASFTFRQAETRKDEYGFTYEIKMLEYISEALI